MIFAIIVPRAVDVVGPVERLVLGAAGGGGAQVAHAVGRPDRPTGITLREREAIAIFFLLIQ